MWKTTRRALSGLRVPLLGNVDLLPGDLLWTRSEGLVGMLIRFGERVKYHGWLQAIWRSLRDLFHLWRKIAEDYDDKSWGNHIAVYVGDGKVIEALAKGLTLSPVSKYTPVKYKRLPLAAVKPDVTDADRQRLVDFAYGDLSFKFHYGWAGITSIVLNETTPSRMAMSWNGSMICSAFGALCWMIAGVPVKLYTWRNPYTAEPSDLADMVETATGTDLSIAA